MKDTIHEIMKDCLYKPDEIENGIPGDVVIVDGILAKFGLNPLKLNANKEKILKIIQKMHPNFFQNTGGGWTFLNLCIDKDGVQWGEHRDCEALIILAIAIDKCKYLLPRDMWSALPGGMPYIMFK